MSGFSFHYDHPFASSLHKCNLVQVPSSFQNCGGSSAPVPRPCSDIYFQDSPSYNFQPDDPKQGAEGPSSAVVCGLNSSHSGYPNGETGVTQMPKMRNKIGPNSKVIVKQKKTAKAGMKSKDQAGAEYIHVRARRGQATDSHSLAERVRREKIGEKMNLLQSIVPGCEKITGKAQVLDEIINYVQSLQIQVQILFSKISILSPYAANQDITPHSSTESICGLDESLSRMMVESSYNPLQFGDESQHNSTVSAASSSSLTSQGDQKHSIPQGVEVPMWERDAQGQFGAIDDCWLDHFAQLE